MKLCVSARQDYQYLDWAQEIIFEYRDHKAIPDFIEKYPDRMIIVTYFIGYDNKEEIDWNQLISYNYLNNGNFLLAINSINLIQKCKDHGIKFYLAYPITSYDELTAALAMGSYYVRLGAPLFFDMDNIERNFPKARIRLIPNIAYDDLYEHQNGIPGTWIRPEDIMMYDEYADVIEFNDADIRKEQALIRIYWEQRVWSGDLQMIITNLNYPGVNRMIPSEVTEKRLNCQQRCVSRHSCRICQRALDLANPDRLEPYRQALENGTLEHIDID